MVFCLWQGEDSHMAQLIPLPLIVSCSSKSRWDLLFWCRLTQAIKQQQQQLRNSSCATAAVATAAAACDNCLQCFNAVG